MSYGSSITINRQEDLRSGTSVPYKDLMWKVEELRRTFYRYNSLDDNYQDGVEQGREQVLDELEDLLKELADEELRKFDKIRDSLVWNARHGARDKIFEKTLKECEDPNKQFHHALKYEDH